MTLSPDTFLEDLKQGRPGTYTRLMELVDDKTITLKKIAHELHFMLKVEEGALLSLLKKLSTEHNWRPKQVVKVDANGKMEIQGGRKKADNKSLFELTEDDMQFLDDFRKGKVGFDKAQRELATRAFAKILADPSSVQVKDWLQSELVLLKKDELIQKKESMEKAMGRMFAGMVVEICPHCGKPVYEEAQVVEEGTVEDYADIKVEG